MQKPITRRTFLQQAGTAGVGLGMMSYISPLARAQSASSANNKITVAVIGTNGRGGAHIQCLTDGLPNV